MPLIKLTDIATDDDLQSRVKIEAEVVDEYASAMQRGESFPPIIVFSDGEKNWLADGYHRYNAAQKAEIERLSAEIRTGTKLDALKFALSANATHGLRRSSADKRRAVLIALEEFGDLSNRELGRMVKVDDKTVGKYRERLAIVNEVKARIANGESFVTLYEGYNLLFVVKLDGPYVKLAYTDDRTYTYTERGVHLDYIEHAVCSITRGLGMGDFEGWGTADAKEALETFWERY